MIEVQITPDELAAATPGTKPTFVKERLKAAGIPVVVDALPGMRFYKKGRMQVDFTHEVQVYRWLPEVPLAEPLFGVGLVMPEDC